jgi:hypothetical protein
VLRRFDEEPEPVNLDRPLCNHLCAELPDCVAALIP